MTRPSLTHGAGVLLAALLMAATVAAQEETLLGDGAHRYAWVRDWPTYDEGFALGNTHGCIALDRAGRIYVNTDSEHAICVFAPSGKLVAKLGADYKGGLHGMAIVVEGDDEFLYVSHTGRHEVVKMSLDGRVIWTLGYPKESGLYENQDSYRPTGVAVAPNGDIYVADGYGLSWVHRFDKDRKYIASFGGPGTEPGKLRCPHGIHCDVRGNEPVLIVADRENHRLQRFSLVGEPLSVHEGNLRRPCNVYPSGKDLVVADLAGRVTVLDEKLDLVVHLGDQPDPALRAQNGVPREKWKVGEFLSPHGIAVDARGHLYVMDWNALGRITKLERRR